MAGHMGSMQVTTQNLIVVEVINDKNLLLVKGGIPGHNDGLVVVKPSIKLQLRESHKKA